MGLTTGRFPATPPGAGAHGMCGCNAAGSARRGLDGSRAPIGHAAPQLMGAE
jgi:hypothetical protein